MLTHFFHAAVTGSYIVATVHKHNFTSGTSHFLLILIHKSTWWTIHNPCQGQSICVNYVKHNNTSYYSPNSGIATLNYSSCHTVFHDTLYILKKRNCAASFYKSWVAFIASALLQLVNSLLIQHKVMQHLHWCSGQLCQYSEVYMQTMFFSTAWNNQYNTV